MIHHFKIQFVSSNDPALHVSYRELSVRVTKLIAWSYREPCLSRKKNGISSSNQADSMVVPRTNPAVRVTKLKAWSYREHFIKRTRQINLKAP